MEPPHVGCYKVIGGFAHLATSTQRVSRMTVMQICPGYWSSFSILEAMSRAMNQA
jgi:hypothetical protein